MTSEKLETIAAWTAICISVGALVVSWLAYRTAHENTEYTRDANRPRVELMKLEIVRATVLVNDPDLLFAVEAINVGPTPAIITREDIANSEVDGIGGLYRESKIALQCFLDWKQEEARIDPPEVAKYGTIEIYKDHPKQIIISKHLPNSCPPLEPTFWADAYIIVPYQDGTGHSYFARRTVKGTLRNNPEIK
jgi:hypothetical protein